MKQDRKNDSINIRGLRLNCHIGVSAAERKKKQIVLADIILKCALSRAGKSDRLEDTVDYSVIAKKISALTGKGKFHLLEALAERLAEICLADSKVKAVMVRVAKKSVLPNIRSVEVEITRHCG